MDFIINNLKQTGIFNTILIAVGIIYDVVRAFSASNALSIIAIAFQLIAYFFALNYAFSGYKKDAAKSFRHFLYGYALSILVTMISSYVRGKAPINSTIFAIIRFILVLILAYGKDLGKLNSYLLAEAVFILSFDTVIRQATNASALFRSLYTILSSLILSAVLWVFIVAKYQDKESRGTK